MNVCVQMTVDMFSNGEIMKSLMIWFKVKI